MPDLTVQLRCVVNITYGPHSSTTHYKVCDIRLDAPDASSVVRELTCPLCGRKFLAAVGSARENVVKRAVRVLIALAGLLVLGLILVNIQGVPDNPWADLSARGDFSVPFLFAGAAILIGVALVAYVRSAGPSASFLHRVEGTHDHEIRPVTAR